MSVKNYPLPFQGFDDHDSFSLEPQYGTLFRNVRSNRRRITRSPGGTLMAPSPVPSGITSVITAGSFLTPTTVGSVVYNHNLSVAPKAFMFIGSLNIGPELPGGLRISTIQDSMHNMIGYSDGTNHGVACHATVDGSNPTATFKTNSTAACILLINDAGTTVVSGVLTASDATTFTINWTVVDTQTHHIGYTLVGGASVSAKVLNWNMNTSLGNQSVTGAGFIPQIVFHLIIGFPPRSLGFGCMTTTAECANDAHAINGVNPTHAQRLTTLTKCLATLTPTYNLAPQIDTSATFVSMDADGFTVDIDNAPTSPLAVTSLCIVGMGQAKISSFNRSTGAAPVTQAVTGTGFHPDWVCLFGSKTTDNAPHSNSHRSFGFGIVSGTTVATDMVKNNSTAFTRSQILTTAIYSLLDTSGVQDVLGTLQSLDSDGFTINWPTNLSTTERIAYIALKGASSDDIGIIRNYAQVYVGAATAVEKLLMLTSKSAFIYTPATSSTGVWTTTPEVYTGSDTDRFSIVNTQAIAAWSQGVDNIRQWDGVSFSDLITVGTNHAARSLIAFADRIISIYPVEGATQFPTQIRWCVNGNVNDWLNAGSGRLEIIETSQDPLVTGFVLGERAYLAKERELIELLWTGSTSPVFGTQPRVRGMGVLAPFSVALAEQFAFWLGPDDIYMWDGSTLTPVGDRVYNTIDALIDYSNLDTIQGAVWTPDSLYLLVVPPYLFVYDYRRDIWYQDDTTNFEAIGIFSVGTNFTADIDHSEFIVIGDSAVQTVRLDQALTDYLGAPIDSYWTTKDYTAEELSGGAQRGFAVSLWNINSLREVRFQSNAGNIVEVGVSVDRGTTWQTTTVTVNSNGVGVAWFQLPFSQIRFRFRDYGTDAYEIHGSWALDFEDSGYLFP